MSKRNKNGISLYYQVESHIREKIESGEWVSGYKLPTEPELCQFFHVSRTTVRQAINSLASAGLLTKKQGSGTYVTQPTYARNRLNTQPNNLVCKYIYGPILQNDLEHSYKNLLLTNICHILMLHEQKLISHDDTRTLLTFILPLLDTHPQTIGNNPLNEDYLLNFEQYLIQHLGIELDGKVQIARSRNDMTPTVMRMNIRDELLVIMKQLFDLLKKMEELAIQNQGKIITGYTHTLPAQPITLDHYFLAVGEALQRDFERLLAAYRTLNQCPLGACALAGTSFPINRDFTARLLGFDGVVVNSLDAVSSRDYLLEVSSTLSTLGSTIARLAQDLILWSTTEFNYLTLADSYSCCSSIMPQKKNALSLEHIRSKTAHLTSAYVDILFTLKGTGFGHSRDLFESMSSMWTLTKETNAILELTTGSLNNITFHYDKMRESAENNNSLLTDLADYIVQKDQISFRNAHTLLATAIRKSDEQEISKLTLKDLNDYANEILGHSISLTEEELQTLQSAKTSVKNKKSDGSPSPSSCQKMLLNFQFALTNDQKHYQSIVNTLQFAEQFRDSQIADILDGLKA